MTNLSQCLSFTLDLRHHTPYPFSLSIIQVDTKDLFEGFNPVILALELPPGSNPSLLPPLDVSLKDDNFRDTPVFQRHLRADNLLREPRLGVGANMPIHGVQVPRHVFSLGKAVHVRELVIVIDALLQDPHTLVGLRTAMDVLVCKPHGCRGNVFGYGAALV